MPVGWHSTQPELTASTPTTHTLHLHKAAAFRNLHLHIGAMACASPAHSAAAAAGATRCCQGHPTRRSGLGGGGCTAIFTQPSRPHPRPAAGVFCFKECPLARTSYILVSVALWPLAIVKTYIECNNSNSVEPRAVTHVPSGPVLVFIQSALTHAK